MPDDFPLVTEQALEAAFATLPFVAGEYSTQCDKWRETVVMSLLAARMLADGLIENLCRTPEDDEGFEKMANALKGTLSAAGAFLDQFRETREPREKRGRLH